jgi:hypothetical protein
VVKPNEQKVSSKKKKKRDRKAEYEKSKAKKAEAEAEAARLASQTPAVESGDGGAYFTIRWCTKANLEFLVGASLELPPVPVSPTAQEPKPKKRPSMSGGPLPGAPRVVDDVDNRGSFQLFNAGWILPADHRRGGRAPPPDKSILPPPKKRQKTGEFALLLLWGWDWSYLTDHTSSRLSIVSTAASENQTLETPAPEEPQPLVAKEEKEEEDAMMQVDATNIPSSPRKPTFAPAPPGTPLGGGILSRTATDAAGRVVIEELDTPEIRRQKKAMRKAEKEKMKIQLMTGLEPELGSVVPETPSAPATLPPDSAPPTPETSVAIGARVISSGSTPGSKEAKVKKPDSARSKKPDSGRSKKPDSGRSRKPGSKGKRPPTPGSPSKGKQPATLPPAPSTTAPTTTDDDSDLSELSDLPSEDAEGEDDDEDGDETEDDPDIPPNQKRQEAQEVDDNDEDGEGEEDVEEEEQPEPRITPANRLQRRVVPSNQVKRRPPPAHAIPAAGPSTAATISTSAKGKKTAGPPVRRGAGKGEYEGGTLVWAKAGMFSLVSVFQWEMC